MRAWDYEITITTHVGAERDHTINNSRICKPCNTHSASFIPDQGSSSSRYCLVPQMVLSAIQPRPAKNLSLSLSQALLHTLHEHPTPSSNPPFCSPATYPSTWAPADPSSSHPDPDPAPKSHSLPSSTRPGLGSQLQHHHRMPHHCPPPAPFCHVWFLLRCLFSHEGVLRRWGGDALLLFH